MLTTNQILQQGRFRVVQPLSGVDFEAFDDVHKTTVILKQFPFGMKKVMNAAQTESLKNSFAVEAKTLMRVQHPSILKIHGWFSEVDANYLVSEFAGGSFLSEMLKRVKKPFPLTEVSNWTDRLLDALGYLHNFAPPLVHRNIKPENLKLTPAGEIKLIVSSLTEEVNPGKLNYLPLEQIWSGLDTASQNLILNSYDENAQKNLEKAADASSDIYALGATLYHLLTAQIPTDALERSIEILEGNADPLKSPHEINPQVPQEISNVLMKALEIRRENRFHSAVIMRQVWRTAFVRLQERKSEVVNEPEEDILDIPIAVVENNLEADRQRIEQERLKIEAEQKQLEERRKVEQERLRIEAENRRQAELLEQQNREAETEKLRFEAQRIEEAQIIEEAQKIEEDFPEFIEETAPTLEIIEESAPIIEPQEEFFPEIINEEKPVETIAPVVSSGDFMESYAEKPKKNSKTMAMAAGAFVVLICVAVAIWFFTSAKPDETNQASSTTEQNTPPIKVETAVMPTETQTAPQTNSSPTVSDSSQIIQTSTTTAPTTAKTKPTATAIATPKSTPEVKKPTVATAKTPAPQKKPVTVEDLINDN